MAVEITLSLPEDLIEQAQKIAKITRRKAEAVLADTLEMMWPTFESVLETDYPAISSLSDAEVMKLADMKMDRTRNDRLGFLQAKGKQSGLTAEERTELSILLQELQIVQLRKSQALVEAVQRGLREPLSA